MIQILTHPATSRLIIGMLFILAGAMHFINPAMYIKIMPDYIPYHRLTVLISGVAEIVGGAGMLFSKTQLWAAWGLIFLLIAVFPANINMTVQVYRHQGAQALYFWLTCLRLPLQFLLIYWVYWAGIQHKL